MMGTQQATGGGEQYGTEPRVEWQSVTSGRAGTGCVLPGVEGPIWRRLRHRQLHVHPGWRAHRRQFVVAIPLCESTFGTRGLGLGALAVDSARGVLAPRRRCRPRLASHDVAVRLVYGASRSAFVEEDPADVGAATDEQGVPGQRPSVHSTPL